MSKSISSFGVVQTNNPSQPLSYFDKYDDAHDLRKSRRQQRITRRMSGKSQFPSEQEARFSKSKKEKQA